MEAPRMGDCELLRRYPVEMKEVEDLEPGKRAPRGFECKKFPTEQNNKIFFFFFFFWQGLLELFHFRKSLSCCFT